VAECPFCRISAGLAPAYVVHEDADLLAFLDERPLFPGHVLLIPRLHCETLLDLPDRLAPTLLIRARLLCAAMERGLAAEGSFVAINNRVSQSVPHLHVHIVPRRRGDGLRGFFWPRGKYRDAEEAESVRQQIEAAVRELAADERR